MLGHSNDNICVTFYLNLTLFLTNRGTKRRRLQNVDMILYACDHKHGKSQQEQLMRAA